MISDEVLTTADRQEALSRAYVMAIAGGSGYTTRQPDFDRESVDISISAGGPMRPSIDIQLKATINLGRPTQGRFRFSLIRRNYDMLREPTMIPRLLVVLALPHHETEWLTVTVDQLVLRRCAYWVCLAGLPETQNDATVTISIPENQRFDGEALRNLMEQARRGAIR